MVKNLPTMQETLVWSLGREYPLKKGMYSCLENAMDRGDWWAMVHGVTESGKTESLSRNAHTHIPLYIHTRSSLSISLSVDIEAASVSWIL